MSCNADLALVVENLGKCYQIYANPKDRLKQFILPKLRSAFNLQPRSYCREFWALKNVSIKVQRGETVGIIGRNGSGKSTFLQLVCGTLNATEGVVEKNGRVAALLELGSGFNPEFSGRENVHMNASLLGLSAQEINERFDSIVEFSGIGDFIDQPVKTYSSGMYVRLAFAVIAHVDADILVIDEALAVGDAVFTQKCMRFLRDFKARGTLLFVSHDMSSVMNLCDKAVWLDQGEIEMIGQSKKVAEKYLHYTLQESYGTEVELQAISSGSAESSDVDRESDADDFTPIVAYESETVAAENLSAATGWSTGAGEVTSVTVSASSGASILVGGELVAVKVKAILHSDFKNPILGFLVRDKLGQDLFGENTLVFTDRTPLSAKTGEIIEGEFTFRLPMLPNGQYTVMASLADGDWHSHIQHHWLHDACVLTVSSSKVRHGLVGIPFKKVDLRKV